MNWPWGELGLPGPADLPEIRRAYARRLKDTRPEENPEGFQRLHSAYQLACRLVRQREAAEALAEETAEALAEEAEELPEEETFPPFRDEAPPAAPRKRGRDWDFERLFAEGEAEERGRRFLRALELRRANGLRWRVWQRRLSRRAEDVGRAWLTACTALQTLELLEATGADGAVWRACLESGLFSTVLDNPDFVFGLEAFLREHPDLPAGACAALDRFCRGRALRWEYWPLLRLLKARLPKRRAGGWWMAALAALCALSALCAAGQWEAQRLEGLLPWLEEDFGRSFRLVWVGLRPRFVAEDEPDLAFFAAPEGARNPEEGSRGYRTDYTFQLLASRLSDYAMAWGYDFHRYPPASARDGGNPWAGRFVLDLPLTGAGEGISALGELFASMEGEEWYLTAPPDFDLYLCWKNWCFYQYGSGGGPFGAIQARTYYQYRFGADLCRLFLERSGIAEEDLGPGSFELAVKPGTMEWGGEPFFQVVGKDGTAASGKPLFSYFLSASGGSLIRVPTEKLDSLRRNGTPLCAGTLERRQAEGFEDGVAVYRLD